MNIAPSFFDIVGIGKEGGGTEGVLEYTIGHTASYETVFSVLIVSILSTTLRATTFELPPPKKKFGNF